MAHAVFGTSSRTFNAVEAGNSRLSNASGGGGGGATAAEIRQELGRNDTIGLSSVDDRAIISRANGATGAIQLFEIDGVTAVVDGSVFKPAGASQVSVIPAPTADMVEGNRYTGTIATGAHNRNAILALSGGTHIVSLSVTMSLGTGSFLQTGAINPLVVGDTLDFEYIQGVSLADFTITVDAASEAIITVLAL